MSLSTYDYESQKKYRNKNRETYNLYMTNLKTRQYHNKSIEEKKAYNKKAYEYTKNRLANDPEYAFNYKEKLRLYYLRRKNKSKEEMQLYSVNIF